MDAIDHIIAQEAALRVFGYHQKMMKLWLIMAGDDLIKSVVRKNLSKEDAVILYKNIENLGLPLPRELPSYMEWIRPMYAAFQEKLRQDPEVTEASKWMLSFPHEVVDPVIGDMCSENLRMVAKAAGGQDTTNRFKNKLSRITSEIIELKKAQALPKARENRSKEANEKDEEVLRVARIILDSRVKPMSKNALAKETAIALEKERDADPSSDEKPWTVKSVTPRLKRICDQLPKGKILPPQNRSRD